MALSEDTLAWRVRQSLEKAQMHQSDLATAINMDPTALSKSLTGKRSFRPLELAQIADTLQVSIDALLADPDHERPAVAMAARVQPDSTPAVADALRFSEMLLELDDLLRVTGHPPEQGKPVDVGSQDDDAIKQGEQAAQDAGKALGFDTTDPPSDFENLVELIETKLNIDVAVESLPHGLDGLSVCRGSFRLALVNSRIPRTRQRFTLAHEVGHIIFGDASEMLIDEDIYNRKTFEEKRANVFAAAFLMPKHSLDGAVSSNTPSEEEIASLLARLGVSPQSLAYRLHNTRIINAVGRNHVLGMSPARLALRSGRAADLQATNDRRIPLLLLNRMVSAWVRGDIGIRPLASLLDTDPDQLLADLTPNPAPPSAQDDLPVGTAL